MVNIKYQYSLPYYVSKIDLGVANFGRGTYRGQGGALTRVNKAFKVTINYKFFLNYMEPFFILFHKRPRKFKSSRSKLMEVLTLTFI